LLGDGLGYCVDFCECVVWTPLPNADTCHLKAVLKNHR
jgi:hypothetical protein